MVPYDGLLKAERRRVSLTLVLHLGNGSRSRCSLIHDVHGWFGWGWTVGIHGGAFTGDVAGLTALVAHFASRTKRSTVWSWAVTRDVTLLGLVLYLPRIKEKAHQLPTGVAFHSMRLAVSRVMIRSPTFVACCRSLSSSESTAEPGPTDEPASWRHNSTTASSDHRATLKTRIGTGTLVTC